MARHTFTPDECSKGGKKGFATVTSRYEWGRKYLKKRMFRSYQKAKKDGKRVHRGT